MSPEEIRKTDVACLAHHALAALGVNSETPTEAVILEHSVAQACLELELVENTLERDLPKESELGSLVYVVAGIRQRLDLAQHSASLLATMATEMNASEGATAPSAEADTVVVSRRWLVDVSRQMNAISEDANVVGHVVAGANDIPSTTGALLRLAERADAIETQIARVLGKSSKEENGG